VAFCTAETAAPIVASGARLKLRLFGITPATIDNTLYDAFGQRHIARIYTALNEYYVILEVNPRYQLGPNALQRIYVLSQNSTMVPLSQIASLNPAVTPIVVNHRLNRQSAAGRFLIAGDRRQFRQILQLRHEFLRIEIELTLVNVDQGVLILRL
jgi:HAE1 family hydrophobic/amphiphilic exporter-1